MSRAALAGVAVAVAAMVAPALAHADQVDDLIAVLQKKPGGMSNDTWREKRRDAARELGRLGDKRAVEPLMKIAESEKFDAVAEIAIQSLGKLGDKRAVPVLERIRDDAGRDQYLRDAAGEALTALGAGEAAPVAPVPEPAEPGEPAAAPAETDVNAAGGEPGTSDSESGEDAALSPVPVPEVGRFGPDVLAMSERWTFAAGTLSLTWDSAVKQPQLSGSAALRYHRGLEEAKLGYSFDGAFVLAGGANDRNGDLSDTGSYAVVGNAVGQTEMRFYLGGPEGIFLHAAGDLALGGSAINVESTLGADFKEFLPSVDAGLALGLGYGRSIEVGSKLRVARIERVLKRARQLGRPINAEVANRLQTAWWDARGELGYRRMLVATVEILRQAGVLLTDPDPTVIYEILRVLEDGQLDGRIEGWDLRIGIAELLAGRENVTADDELDFHREEAAVVSGRLGRQMQGALAELVGQLRGVYRLDDGSAEYPGYWAAEADLAWRRYFYGEAWDPRGALELGVTARAGDRDTDDDDGGQGRTYALRAGYLAYFSRTSRLAATATLRFEGQDLFLGVGVSGTWSLADASYAAW